VTKDRREVALLEKGGVGGTFPLAHQLKGKGHQDLIETDQREGT